MILTSIGRSSCYGLSLFFTFADMRHSAYLQYNDGC
ncbi:hypothetical protein Lepto7376_3123 [[Leptolyngbya] sp. PCC 7376]|nr:hypothetical protein Lepto7376_3123 [[Leptolyngbya] sp. PCC 7376]